MPIIEVEHLTKEYRLGTLTSLRDSLTNLGRRLTGRPPLERERFKALDDVSFSVEEGEVVGIIGHNGAGKSTLLKILAKVTTPTKGRVYVGGSVAPLIEVGAGINPELTGRENIYLNASILGIPKKIIRRKIDEIIEFSELEQFIDTPVKRYSSGMQVKLGFAIATSLDAEILIIDEVLAVGDLAFQRKCFDRMEELIKRRGKTVLVVSHNLRQIQRLSTRVILLDHGKIIQDGNPEPTCNMFYELSEKRIQTNRAGATTKIQSTEEVHLLNIQLTDGCGIPVDVINYGEDAFVKIQIQIKKPLFHPKIALGIHTTDFLYLATEGTSIRSILEPGVYTVLCKIRNFPFIPRLYSLRVSIDAGVYSSTVFYGENLKHFQVTHPKFNKDIEGFVRMNCEWWIDEVKTPEKVDYESSSQPEEME
ncbi:lipopolysaccharide transport system ATP-binding protein [Methylomarinovum caldicuralii]|uniref:Lipopolysaccharide transport system ATP-binding protein n=1 Tax=Methylomarinovum caldicuralii TaxID=438856 RepID=A0AAU9BTA0_9GAMM|nr:ABC transporter ATP-binding protein [Methylomarinovum caldicuralii]BCX82113.1 lipopolysaccharide transport system ATP-binding protein [Methylomarinovum caldicuralii]